MPQLKDTDWQIGQSQDPSLCCIQETHLNAKTHMGKNEGMEEYLPSIKTEIAILVSDKTDFKPTKIKKDKEGHYIMVKRSMQQEELIILNNMHPIQGHSDP